MWATSTLSQTLSYHRGTTTNFRISWGGPRATETFVRRETGWMVAICRRILRDDALAKDCVQNAFVNVFKFLGAFKGDSKLKTWMYRIVVNQALMDLRKRRRLQEEPINGLLPEF